VVYPNPAGQGPVLLNIPLPHGAAQVKVRVFTTAFRKVYEADQSHVPPGNFTLPLPLQDEGGRPLANGLYYLLVESPQGKTVIKLLVIR
jgi:hypothetical protein